MPFVAFSGKDSKIDRPYMVTGIEKSVKLTLEVNQGGESHSFSVHFFPEDGEGVEEYCHKTISKWLLDIPDAEVPERW